MNLRGAASALVLTSVAVAMSITVVFLAPFPLMLLRRNGGRMSFFISTGIVGLLLCLLAPPVTAGYFLASAILALVLSEAEDQNLGYTNSFFVALLVLLGFGAMATGFAMNHYGFEPVSFFTDQINTGLSQLSLPSGVSVDKGALIKQVPSALLIMVIFSIWINSILVTRFEMLLGWTASFQRHKFLNSELRGWKLPDFFVWIALLSIGGTFFEIEPMWLHWVAANVLNVVIMLYFFQGLAVIVNFFTVKKVSPLWRAIAYVLIFSQLFLMVAFIGFADLWLEFRKRTNSDKSAVA